MEKILVSACLLGVSCRYDGTSNANEDIIKLMDKYEFIPVCPEILGGLATPREPSEIVGGAVMSKGGVDVTEQFVKGAEETLKLAKLYGCKKAVLKEKSPSCGFKKVYDGTFSKVLVEGNGIAADMLFKNGIAVTGEIDLGLLHLL